VNSLQVLLQLMLSLTWKITYGTFFNAFSILYTKVNRIVVSLQVASVVRFKITLVTFVEGTFISMTVLHVSFQTVFSLYRIIAFITVQKFATRIRFFFMNKLLMFLKTLN